MLMLSISLLIEVSSSKTIMQLPHQIYPIQIKLTLSHPQAPYPMRSQSLVTIKPRQKTHALIPTISAQLVPPTFSRQQNRNRSIDSFRDFQNSISKLNFNSKSTSLHKPKLEETNLRLSKLFPNGLKTKQLKGIDDRLKQKLYIDEQMELVYGKEVQSYENKKSVLEKRLNEIRTRNNLRIKEVQEFEENVIQKYRLEFNKDKQEFNRLSELYKKLSEEEEMAEMKYNIKRQKVSQDQEKIQEEQRRFINFINNLKNENATLLKNPAEITKFNLSPSSNPKDPNATNPSPNPKKHSQEQVTVKQSATVHKSPQLRAGLNPKEIGDQYLEENKRNSLKNKKRDITPINLKSIDYNPQVKQRLEKNEKTLSSMPIRSQEIKPTKRAFTISQGVQPDVVYRESAYSDEKKSNP